MTAVLLPNGKQQYFTTAGAPAVGYKVATFDAGTSNPRITWQDSGKVAPNTNPVILDARGEASIFWEGAYKVQLQDSTGAVIWTQDNLQSQPNSFSASLVPAVTNTVDLGSITISWRNLYLGANNAPVLDPVSGNVGYYARTAVEISLAIIPTNFVYPDGDIRRYGALTGAATNAAAINNALLVSANGGRAAYIPPGIWIHTTAITVPAASSMYGEGGISVLRPNGCDGLVFALDAAAQPIRRYFGKFAIIGVTTDTFSAIKTTVQPSAAWFIDFHDIGIQNFGTAINAQGFRGCNFIGIAGMSNYVGISFAGQNTNIEVIGCHFIRGTLVGAGGAYGIRIQQSGGNTTQSTQITDTYVFGYDIGLKCDLGFETQVVSCDFSNCLIKGVEVTSTIGGFWLEDCWIEVINPAQTHGVDVANITPSTTAKVWINRNFLRATTAVAGTIGINLGNANVGAQVNDNHVLGFDKGINIGAATNVTCRGNTVNINTTVYSATSYAIQLNSSANDVQLGPNYIVPGTPAAVTMAAASPNLLVTPGGYPVGTPVQFDASQNGFFVGVTYYVVGVGGNFIQVGATPGGATIAATGAVAVNVFQAPLPVVLTGSTPPPGFNFSARGSFLGSLTGMTATVQSPMDWFVNGYSPVITVRGGANLTGTSSAITMTMVGVPSLLFPVTATQSFMASTEDAGAFGYGLASMSTAGVFSFFKTAGGGVFTNVGQKGIGNFPMTYTYS